MKRNCFYTVTLILATLVLGCQDPFGLLPTMNAAPGELGVRTVTAGTIVNPKDKLPLQISYDTTGGAPDLLTVTVYAQDDSANANPLSQLTLNGSEVTENPMRPIELNSDLARGAYKFEFVLSRNGTVLSRNTVPFFYEPKPYNIQGVRSYPSTILPGSDGLLEVNIAAGKSIQPASSAGQVSANPLAASRQLAVAASGKTSAQPGLDSDDYFVRWWDGDKLLASGSYKSGAGRYHLSAPGKEGLYSYRVEVFPANPSNVGDVSYTSSVSKVVSVVVGDSDVGGFSPASDYSNLLHFQGNLSEEGWMSGQASTFHFEGQRLFSYVSDTLGYSLGEGTTLVGDKVWLPAQNGLFSSYGIFLRFVPVSIASGNLLKMSSADGSRSFGLSANRDGSIAVTMHSGGLNLTGSSVPGILQTAVPSLLQVFVSTYGGSLSLVVQNGTDTLIKISQKITDPGNLSDNASIKGRSEIGSVDGIKLLVDEFGVFRPQEDIGKDLFSLAMYYRYGQTLRLAEDFAASTAPAGFATTGDVKFVDSQALLYGGSTLSLPPVSSLKKVLRFDLLFDTHSDLNFSTLSIWPSEQGNDQNMAQDPVVLNLSGEIVYLGSHIKLNGYERNPLTFSIDPQSGKTTLNWAGKSVKVNWNLSGQSILNIKLGNNSESPVAVGLDNVLSVSEAGQDPLEK